MTNLDEDELREVREVLSAWTMEGFALEDVKKRVDPATYERIERSRLSLTKLDRVIEGMEQPVVVNDLLVAISHLSACQGFMQANAEHEGDDSRWWYYIKLLDKVKGIIERTSIPPQPESDA